MNTFTFKIATPDGTAFAGEIVRVRMRGIEGELAVMAGHTPFATSVHKGEITVSVDEETTKRFIIEDGLLGVSARETILLSPSVREIGEA